MAYGRLLLAWDNKADSAALSASSEVAAQPGSNVQQVHLSRKWQTATGVKSASLTLDLGSSLSCSLLAVLGTNFTAAATRRLRASDADPTAVAGDKYDSALGAAGVKAGYGAIYLYFAAVAARYWRIDLADAALPDNMAVGRVSLGPSWTPGESHEWGWSVTAQDDSKPVESYGGQTYSDVRPQKRVLQFGLSWNSEADMYDNAFAMARSQGVVKDVLAIQNINSAYLSEQAVFGLCVASEPLVQDKLKNYRQKFTIRERL
jgi:hypothetical protein